jgi:pyrroline-5-carboxylate reductase
MKFGIIGTGVMAGAMLESALAAGFLKKEDVLVYDKRPEAAARFGVETAESAKQVAAQCDIVQLGVKPQDIPALLEKIDEILHTKKSLVISIAAGVPLKRIAVYAHRAARLMPNVNTAVGQSMTAYCATERVGPEHLDWLKGYCECFGRAVHLEEKHFSAFTALAGSVPAFVYLFIDELARAGVTAGLPKALALEIAAQTVFGSAMQVQESSVHTDTTEGRLHPYELADQVCSPGGTTIAGVNALREHGFAHAVSQAVLASYKRDQELGK